MGRRAGSQRCFPTYFDWMFRIDAASQKPSPRRDRTDVISMVLAGIGDIVVAQNLTFNTQNALCWPNDGAYKCYSMNISTSIISVRTLAIGYLCCRHFVGYQWNI